MSDSLQPHGLWPTRLLHPWDFPGKNTGVGCHFLLQKIFPTQGSNPGLPYHRQTLYHLNQGSPLSPLRASLVAQKVKRLPAVRETQVLSQGWEDLLEKEMATHSSILAWKIPWTEESGKPQSMGLQRVGHD